MAQSRPAKLYSPAVLGLATGLSAFPLDDALPLRAEARSRSCGSVITLGLRLGDDARIARIGLRVSACAIGQASAAILAQSAATRDPAEIAATATAIADWLAGDAAVPVWPGLDALILARDHPGRHDALLLPWKAACMALSCGAAGG